jgi:hypothetical protein
MRIGHRRWFPLFCILYSAFCIPSLGFAAEAWTLTSADLGATAVSLKSIDASGLHVANVDGSNGRVVPMSDFAELERSVAITPPSGKFVLHLLGGDHIAGDPVAIKGESIVWRHPTVGELTVPMRELKAMTRPGGRPSEERRKEDVVTLSNKDVVRGAVADLAPDKVTVQTDAGATPVPLDSVDSIGFAAAAQTGNANKPAYRVRLDDDSSIVGSAIALAAGADKLKLTLPGAAPRDIDLAHVANIEQVNGPVSWLSGRPPSESVYIPYFGNDQRYPARMNTNLSGDPIRFKDRKFARGIGVHSYSRLSWPLDGKSYVAFRTRYAIDPAAEVERADVTVRIKLDDKVVHEQEHVRPGVLSPVVVVDLGQAKKLTLEVDYGENIHSGDRLNWIEPALLKVKPAPEPTAPATAPATEPSAQPTTQPAATQPATQPATRPA